MVATCQWQDIVPSAKMTVDVETAGVDDLAVVGEDAQYLARTVMTSVTYWQVWWSATVIFWPHRSIRALDRM